VGVLRLLANLADHPAPPVDSPAGRVIFATHPDAHSARMRKELDPWSVSWLLSSNAPHSSAT
jgi:hypothetical protein